MVSLSAVNDVLGSIGTFKAYHLKLPFMASNLPPPTQNTYVLSISLPNAFHNRHTPTTSSFSAPSTEHLSVIPTILILSHTLAVQFSTAHMIERPTRFQISKGTHSSTLTLTHTPAPNVSLNICPTLLFAAFPWNNYHSHHPAQPL